MASLGDLPVGYHYDFLLDCPQTKTALDSAASAPHRLSGGLTNGDPPSKGGDWSEINFAVLDEESQAEHNGFSINMLVGDASPSGDMGVSSRPH